MKNRVIIILLSVVSICACTENESFPSEATTVNAVLEGYTWHTGDMISLFDGGKNLLLTSFTEGEKACFEAETLPNKALVVFPGNKSYELTNMDLEVSFTAKPRVIPEEKLILDEQTNSPKQVFTIKLCSDGSFMLIASNNKYVKGNCKGYINDPGTKRPIAFRAAALGNRTFRITTQASKFKKVLSSNKNGVLVIKRFSPNDKGAVWIIKKEI